MNTFVIFYLFATLFVHNAKSRYQNGYHIKIQEFPSLASVQLNHHHICNSVIIGADLILTSALCV